MVVNTGVGRRHMSEAHTRDLETLLSRSEVGKLLLATDEKALSEEKDVAQDAQDPPGTLDLLAALGGRHRFRVHGIIS